MAKTYYSKLLTREAVAEAEHHHNLICSALNSPLSQGRKGGGEGKRKKIYNP
jgi:hypothetical protein